MPEYLIFYYKHPDTYVYRYDSRSREQLTKHVCQQATDPNLTLSWYDAATIVKTANDLSTENQ